MSTLIILFFLALIIVTPVVEPFTKLSAYAIFAPVIAAS